MDDAGPSKVCQKEICTILGILKNPSILVIKSKFVAYRNKFKNTRIRAEKNWAYYAAEFCKCENDLKKTWSLIRSMMKFGNHGNHEPGIESIQVNGERIEDTEIMANKFNNYFTNIANSLAEKIKNPTLSFEKYMQPSIINSFAVSPISPEEIVGLTVSRIIRLAHSKGVDDY